MKVCIIGNNLTGLILASILSKKNFFIEIYSIKGKKLNFPTRTLGITSDNLDYLQKYFKGISKKTHPIEEIKVLIKNEKINEKIIFNKNSKPHFHMIKYDKLITYLKSKVKLKQGRLSTKSGYKKAIVTLKKGQSIDLTTGI